MLYIDMPESYSLISDLKISPYKTARVSFIVLCSEGNNFDAVIPVAALLFLNFDAIYLLASTIFHKILP